MYQIDHRVRFAGVEMALLFVKGSRVIDDGDVVADMAEQATEFGFRPIHA